MNDRRAFLLTAGSARDDLRDLRLEVAKQQGEQLMKSKRRDCRNIVAVVGIVLLGLGIAVAKADSLYIGDVNDNTIKRFDASTGKYLGVFVTKNGCPQNPPSSPPIGCLYGPRGLVFDGSGHLLVVDQNASPPLPPPPPQAGKPPVLIFPGAIYEYSAQTGTFVKPLVPYTDPNAPPEPRGMVLYNHVLFVASQGLGSDNAAPCMLNAPNGTGCVQAFDVSNENNVKFLGFLLPPENLAASFHPRGVVIGPDNLLYASNVPNPPPPEGSGLGGQILVYDPETLRFKTFVDNDTCSPPPPLTSCDFNRPEGLVFGPDKNLYVTSFRATSSDTDKILVFAGPFNSNFKPGAFIGQIVLDQVGDARAYGQALLFGPGDKLFVPISATGSYSGQVRLYDVSNVSLKPTLTPFNLFVPSGSQQNSPLGLGWYLTFGNTDPATLNYVSAR
jgi:WD40 repeat protein